MAMNNELVTRVVAQIDELQHLPLEQRIDAINSIRAALHTYSPFAAEPVDCVRWVKAESVTANDYNPNSVAPPEMELLKVSIIQDGYTQPIVSWKNAATKKVDPQDQLSQTRMPTPEVYAQVIENTPGMSEAAKKEAIDAYT
jgi:hypothetical protein